MHTADDIWWREKSCKGRQSNISSCQAGKDTVRKFLIGSYDYLKEQGKLYFVMRKDHGVKSMIKEMSSLFEVNIINKDKGFYVVLATKR